MLLTLIDVPPLSPLKKAVEASYIFDVMETIHANFIKAPCRILKNPGLRGYQLVLLSCQTNNHCKCKE